MAIMPARAKTSEFVGSRLISFGRKEYRNTVRGVNPQFERMRNTIAEKGRFIDAEDLAAGRSADCNGNGNMTETHIDGMAEGLVKALIGVFKAFVEFVAKLISAALEWITSMLQILFEKIFKPIIDGFVHMVQQFGQLVNSTRAAEPYAPLRTTQGFNE